jgi:uncharacterized protein
MPETARQWLLHAEGCRQRADIPGAVEAFRTAALLYWDGGKAPQARASLKMALRLVPRDPFVLAELRSYEARSKPSETEASVGFEDFADAPTQSLTPEEWRALMRGREAKN